MALQRWFAQSGKFTYSLNVHQPDTAQALIGSQIEEAAGLPGGGQPGDDAAVSLRFTDGSLATIAYASATYATRWRTPYSRISA